MGPKSSCTPDESLDLPEAECGIVVTDCGKDGLEKTAKGCGDVIG